MAIAPDQLSIMAKEFFQQIRLMAEVIIFSWTVLVAKVSLTELWVRLQVLAYIVAFAWLLFTFNSLLLNKQLNRWGVRPHTLSGLLCMPLAVFLHSNLGHIRGNTEGFLVFGGRLLLLKGVQTFTLVSLVVFLADGLGTWLFGDEKSNHYGASGMVLGYFGFLLLRGYFERDTTSALLSMLMAAFFITNLAYLEPREGISFEGHLFGFLGGVIAAIYLDPIKTIAPVPV